MSWKRPNVFKRMTPLVKILPQNIYGTWIDIGSGDGVFSHILDQEFNIDYLIQIDNKYLKKVSDDALLCDLNNLPFRKSSFNGILCSQVLHYYPNKEIDIIFKKFNTILNYLGYIIIIEYKINKSYNWIPFPKKLNVLIQQSEKSDFYFKEKIEIDDYNRPKFSILFSKLK